MSLLSDNRRIRELVASWISGNRKDVVEELLGEPKPGLAETLRMGVYDALDKDDRRVFFKLMTLHLQEPKP